MLLEYKMQMTSRLPEQLVREAKHLYMGKANRQREEDEKIAARQDSTVVGNQILRLMPSSTPDFMHIPLDFLGFCLVNIVEEGLLMPGKPNLGVFKYNDKYCVFADNESIQKYIENPDKYLQSVVE